MLPPESIDLLRARDGRYIGLSEAMLATLAAEWPDESESSPMHEALRHCLEPITPNNRELLDLFPAFCDFAGLPARGRSMAKAFFRSYCAKDRRQTRCLLPMDNGRTVRTQRWRLIEWPEHAPLI